MNYRVVLADDEPEVLRSIQRTLDWEKYGFSVVGAFLNGLDVLEFLENHDVDIVFTDIRMPFMDGIELMHKIKEKYPYIKLVIISGYDDFQYAKEALIHGVLDYILKPINAREMSEVLQKVKDKMDTELEEKQSIQKLRNLYLENQPIIRENFLNRLVVGNIKAKALQEEKKTGLHFLFLQDSRTLRLKKSLTGFRIIWRSCRSMPVRIRSWNGWKNSASA